MIYCALRSVAFLIAIAALHGCTWYVYDATYRPIASNITGRCFALSEDAILSEHFSYFTAYMLNLPGSNECTPQSVMPTTKDEERYKFSGLKPPQCTWIPAANIAKGTKFRVNTVTEQPYGGPGRCWQVEVTLITGESAGITSRIPSCHFDFPASELWIRMRSVNEYIEPLELLDRVAKPCSE